MQEKILSLIGDIVSREAPAFAGRILVERPKDVSHGDWTTNISFMLAKELKESPIDIAVRFAAEIKNSTDLFAKVESVAGYINFTFTDEAYLEILADLVESSLESDEYEGKKVVVEYTQPNPFKPFHIGHLMSNAIGESLARLIQAAGADVVRANYQGDVGPHVAKALWSLRKEGDDAKDIAVVGKAYAEGHAASHSSEEAKIEIARLNKAVYEKSDNAVNELYQEGRETTLAHFEEIYKTLGTTFDQYYFESEVWESGKAIVLSHVGTIFEESDGAIIFPGEKYGLHTRVFITKEGLPTYEAKEIGLASRKHEMNTADFYIIDTAVEQASYFAVVTKAIELCFPDLEGKIKHVSHGMMQLTDGKMSSRSGNVVTGKELIDSALATAQEKITERSDATSSDDLVRMIAVAGIKFSILKQAIGKNISYDQDAALSFEGDAGPYLQYTYARCLSVSEKSEKSGDLVYDPACLTVIRLLDQYKELVRLSAVQRAPHMVANHLLAIAHAYNTFYAAHKIISDEPTSAFRVAVTQATARVVEHGLFVLGIEAPQKM